jgi:glutathione synthase/RimK-type ligase-like ATP-grasp enzyme
MSRAVGLQGLRYVAIANPGGKRWQTYARELAAFWEERGFRPEVEVVPWSVVVPRDGNLDGFTAFDRPALVRLESPGRDAEVERLLLQAGAREIPEETGTDWLALPYHKGELIRPRLLYRGFCRVLNGLSQAFASRPHLRPLASPRAIAELFDKNATAARLDGAGLPTPPSLEPPATPELLLDALRARHFPTAYVKLNTGSSASGIVVVHPLGERPWGVSSVARLRGGFYSTRRLRRHEGDNLRAVLQFLLEEGACVQRGIPMAQIDGQNFDVRVVAVYGKPAFVVFRLSDQPMTNLHLGGRRGRFDVCRASIPTRSWLDALDHCGEAARLYDCAMVGIDLLFERGYGRHYLLEVNAFGDFFPGLTDPRGRTAHRAEIEATAGRIGVEVRPEVF